MFARKGVVDNALAGVTVAFVALPLNLALALACGLPPVMGLVTGVVTGVLAGMLGGSKLQITGPEVALAPLTLEIVSQHGLKGLFAATFLAGLLQIAGGLLRVGRLVHAIPRPVVGGFLAAVGLLVFDAQLPRLLGLPADVKLMSSVAPHQALLMADWASVALGAVVIGSFVLLPRASPRIPGALLGLAAVVVALSLTGATLPTVGAVDLRSLQVALPALGDVDLWALAPEAVALALLCSIDSLLCAVSLDTMTRSARHRSDQELVAQGLANVAASLIGGMPVAGAVVRSMAAVQARATTRLVTVVQSLTLLLLMLLAAPLVAAVPLTGLAGILLVVGYRLVKWQELLLLWRISRFEAAAFVATAVSILVGDFVSGVATGLIVALLHFAVQHSRLALSARTGATRQGAAVHATTIVEIDGPIFFASHTQLEALVQREGRGNLVLDLRTVPMVDVTGADALNAVIDRLAVQGTRVLAVGARDGVARQLTELGVVKRLFGARLFPSVDAALDELHRAERAAAQPLEPSAAPRFQLNVTQPAAN